ncbi:MAG: hypothetical protein WAM85_05955 [Terracidiphilus sp.]
MEKVRIRDARRGNECELTAMRAMLWRDATAEVQRRQMELLMQSGMSGTLPATILVAPDGEEVMTGFIEVCERGTNPLRDGG